MTMNDNFCCCNCFTCNMFYIYVHSVLFSLLSVSQCHVQLSVLYAGNYCICLFLLLLFFFILFIDSNRRDLLYRYSHTRCWETLRIHSIKSIRYVLFLFIYFFIIIIVLFKLIIRFFLHFH